VVTGSLVKAKVVKNKVAAPFRSAEFDIIYTEGISREASLLDIGVTLDVVKKQGAWFSFNDTKIGQGKEGARLYLKENPKLASEIEKKVRESAAKPR
jgi:recombination protein RecA